MNMTKAASCAAVIAGADIGMFGRDALDAGKDAANIFVSSLAADYISQPTDSLVPEGTEDIANIAIGGGIYAALDNVVEASPFGTMLGKFLYGIGNLAVGSNYVYPLIATNVNGS